MRNDMITEMFGPGVARSRVGRDVHTAPVDALVRIPILDERALDLFSTEEHGVIQSAKTGSRLEHRTAPMYLRNGDSNRIQTYRGFIEPSGVFYADKGHELNCPCPVGKPANLAPERTSSLSVAQIDFVQFICQHQRGVIRTNTIEQAATCVAILVCMLPGLRVAVAVKNGRLAKLMRRIVKSQLKRYAFANQHGNVDIGTFPSIAEKVSHNKHDVVFVLDAVKGLSDWGRNCVLSATHAKTFGFLLSSSRAAQQDVDYLRALYGFRERVVPEVGYDEMRISTAWFDFRWYPEHATDGGSSHDIKRQELWHLAIRNRLIAKLSRVINTGDRTTLEKQFSGLAETVSLDRPMRTAILVETIDHAAHLLPHLRFPRLFAGSPLVLNGMSYQQQQRVQNAVNCRGGTDPIIVTFDGLRSFPLSKVDAIIRADGGEGMPPIPRLVKSRDGAHGHHNLLLVDINDKHHSYLRSCSRKRRRAYLQREWYFQGADPTIERIRQWISQKLEGNR